MTHDPLLLEDDVTTQDLKSLYPLFYRNKAIANLAYHKRWAVSDPVTKMPVSMRGLVMYKTIWGASSKKASDMWTLIDLAKRMPRLSNCALSLEGEKMGYAVVDIESTCSDKMRNRLMKLPWAYAERSLSGKGVHLLIPYPNDLIAAYPNAKKAALKAPNKTWELLLEHWVTFTRDTLDPADYPDRGTLSLRDVLEPLFEAQKPAMASVTQSADDVKDEDIPGYEDRKNMVLVSHGDTFRYDPSKRGGDLSSADMSLCCQVVRAVRMNLENAVDDDKLVKFTYHMAMDVFETYTKEHGIWRDKYEEARNDTTWIEMTMWKAIGTVLSDVIRKQQGEANA
jgi:hypothetical protein